MHSIITLKNSKWVKDYNKFFFLSNKFRDSTKISNTEMTDEIFSNIFASVNTIVIVIPKGDNKHKDVSYKIREADDGKRNEIKEILRLNEVEFHSVELHDQIKKANCKDDVHYYKFSEYTEINDFLEYVNPSKSVTIKVYTNLENEDKKIEPMTINNIDKSVHTNDNSTHKTINKDNSTKIEVSTRGNFNKTKIEIQGAKEKSWWNTLTGFILKLIGKNS